MAILSALSLKQPWATLVAHGLKTIEVRSWYTHRRGRLLIHAARIPDRRPEGWRYLPPHLQSAAEQRGGIVGMGELVGCRAYRTAEELQCDQALHLNEPTWFRPPVLYGLQLGDLHPLHFHPCAGQTRFFRVDLPPGHAEEKPGDGDGRQTGKPIRLLVSVRTSEEAAAALAGGADLIDVKEPERGSLGRAAEEVLAGILDLVGQQRPVSAALGEQGQLLAAGLPGAVSRLRHVKWGLAGTQEAGGDWRVAWQHLADRVVGSAPGCTPVLVGYSDACRAGAPDWWEVSRLALARPGGALLLDTWRKDDTTLLDWIPPASLRMLADCCRRAGVTLALAGSLGPAQLDLVRHIGPDWLAVRGAACTGGRLGPVEEDRVRALRAQLDQPLPPVPIQPVTTTL